MLVLPTERGRKNRVARARETTAAESADRSRGAREHSVGTAEVGVWARDHVGAAGVQAPDVEHAEKDVRRPQDALRRTGVPRPRGQAFLAPNCFHWQDGAAVFRFRVHACLRRGSRGWAAARCSVRGGGSMHGGLR